MNRLGSWVISTVFCYVMCTGLTALAGDGSVDPATGDAEFAVNFRFPPTEDQIENAKLSLERMSMMLCDATDGQFRMRRIRLTAGAAEEDRAGFWFQALPGRSGGSFYIDGSNFGTLGRRLNIFRSAINQPDVLAHEFGHHTFGLGEQYGEQRRFGGACGIGLGFEPGTVDERNHSLMQQSGYVQCVGGASNGSRCLTNGDCPGGSCQAVLMSEFSVAANHDPVQGDNVLCPAAQPITSIAFTGNLSNGGMVQVFDDSDFTTAENSSSANRNIEAIDGLGGLPANTLRFYATRTGAAEWIISTGIDGGEVGGTTGDLEILEQWTLDFNGDGSLRSISEDPPILRVTGLSSGAADLDITMNFGTPNPTAVPGQGTDGFVMGGGDTSIRDSHDGFPLCTASDCSARWNSTTGLWETTHQSLIHNGESDWETIATNYSFITPPAGLPQEDSPPRCLAGVTFDEDVAGTDQALLIMDRSGSMAWSSREGVAEVCANGRDDDNDGDVDETECADSRISFAQAAARAFVDLQTDVGIDLGLLEFDDSNSLVRPIDVLNAGNFEDFKTDIDGLRPGNDTAIGDALDASHTEFTRVADIGRSRTAFLLTDGYNNSGVDPEAAADRLEDIGVRIYTIPTGTDVDTELLSDLAAQTGAAMFEARNSNELTAIYAEMAARYRGAGIVFPRHNFILAKNPEKYQKEQETMSDKITPGIRFVIPVEKGARSLTGFLSGRNKHMRTWKVRFQLIGPAGELFTPSSPEVTVDSHYTFINIPLPSPGDWLIDISPDNEDLQESTLIAFADNPRPRLFSDVRPRVVLPGTPVTITADPIDMVDLDGTDVTVDALVTRPDGSVKFLSLAQNSRGVWTAKFDDYVGRGVYKISLEANVGPDAQPFKGESIFEGPERAPIKVEPFRRHSTAQFFVGGSFPPCENSKDCDEDGIPDDAECGEDTDKDGVPDYRDTDSDNDEIPDAVEAGQDRNHNNIPDACEPGPVITPDKPDDKERCDQIIMEENLLIKQLCTIRINTAPSRVLKANIAALRNLAKEASRKGLFRKYPKLRIMFEEVFERKTKVLSMLQDGRINCKVVKELLGEAIKYEKQICELISTKK